MIHNHFQNSKKHLCILEASNILWLFIWVWNVDDENERIKHDKIIDHEKIFSMIYIIDITKLFYSWINKYHLSFWIHIQLSFILRSIFDLWFENYTIESNSMYHMRNNLSFLPSLIAHTLFNFETYRSILMIPLLSKLKLSIVEFKW